MKLTNLYIDCLENILEYLEFGDFLSAASSNKRLNKAANFIFVRKYCQKIINFEDICISRDGSFQIGTYSIYIRDLKTSLQFIRCFGHLVSRIQLTQKQFDLDHHVINYLNEYCSDSITWMRIKNGLKGWEHLQKPFFKVKQVFLERCHIAAVDFLNELFPKMHQLNCYYFSREVLSGISTHFPDLKYLSIIDDTPSASISCGDSIAPALRLNPQITYFNITTDDALLDSSDFQNAIKTLQKLETLHLSVKTLSSKSFDSEIHLKSVRRFNIDIRSNDVIEIPFSFGQLENLTMAVPHELNAAFYSFVDKHPTIKDLKSNVSNLSVIDQTKIAKSLPLLTTIWFYTCKLSPNEAAHLMSKFQNLRNFSFYINEVTAYDDFRALLNIDWECEISKYGWVSVTKCSPSAKKRKIN